jgi:hypothetical protein
MKVIAAMVTTGVLGAGLGLAGCAAGAAATAASSSSSGTSPPAASSSRAVPAPTATKTVIKTVHAAAPTTQADAPASSAPAAPAAPTTQAAAPAAPQPPGGANVTDPWAVVSAYYGDIESGNYAQAYALIGSGSTTGQSYGEFAAGYSCTGGQDVSQNWESGDQVNFDLAATDSCTGEIQYYTGTDTVENGTIVGAQITQTG